MTERVRCISCAWRGPGRPNTPCARCADGLLLRDWRAAMIDRDVKPENVTPRRDLIAERAQRPEPPPPRPFDAAADRAAEADELSWLDLCHRHDPTELRL